MTLRKEVDALGWSICGSMAAGRLRWVTDRVARGADLVGRQMKRERTRSSEAKRTSGREICVGRTHHYRKVA